jgi:hypothetical protein
MATTIITKHGTGTPTSLAVGELAIDKSGPTLFTNTGSGVEAFSSGGGGGTTLFRPFNPADVSITGATGGNFFIDHNSNTTGYRLIIKANNILTVPSALTVTAPSGYAWLIQYTDGYNSTKTGGNPTKTIFRLGNTQQGGGKTKVTLSGFNGTSDNVVMGLSTTSNDAEGGLTNYQNDTVGLGAAPFTCTSFTFHGPFNQTWYTNAAIYIYNISIVSA